MQNVQMLAKNESKHYKHIKKQRKSMELAFIHNIVEIL